VPPIGFVGPWTSPPPRRLPRHPLHFHGRILKVYDIVTGEYDSIQGAIEPANGLKLETLVPGFDGPRNGSWADSFLYVHYLDIAYALLRLIARPIVHARHLSVL